MKLKSLKRLVVTSAVAVTVTAVAVSTMQVTGTQAAPLAAAAASVDAASTTARAAVSETAPDSDAEHSSTHEHAPGEGHRHDGTATPGHAHDEVEAPGHTHDEGEAKGHSHARPTSAARGETRMIKGKNGRPDVEVHELTDRQEAAATDTKSLYRRAGLPQPTASKLANATGTAGAAAGPAGATSVPTLAKHVAPSCTGTGTDLNRVQVLYVREQGTASRYSAVTALLRNEVANVDDAYAVSARKTGGGRRVRWVMDANCVPTIPEVVIPTGAFSDPNGALTAIAAQGYGDTNRKYLAFADINQVCGYAQLFKDTSTTNNANNGGRAQYARVDVGCWASSNHSTAGHELTHMLGAVQVDAPHATAPGHCTDDSDLMCYNDGTGQARTNTCPEDDAALLDCGNDDYFTTAPPSGSYLATHWNTASSSFLDTVPALPAAPVVTVAASDSDPDTGELITFTATSSQTGAFAWTTAYPTCGIAGTPTTGRTFQMRCPSGYTGQISAKATLTTTDGAYTGTGTRSVLVHQSGAPRATIAAPANARAGTPFTMTAMPTGVAPFTYRWGIPDACTKNSTVSREITVTCPTAGGMTAQLAVVQADRQSALASTNVTVLAPLTVAVTGQDSVVAGQTADLTAVVRNPGAGVTYAWTSQNGWLSGSATAPQVTVAAPGTAAGTSDVVTVVVTAADGATVTTTKSLTVTDRHLVTLSAPTATRSTDTLFATRLVDQSTGAAVGGAALSLMYAPLTGGTPVKVASATTLADGWGRVEYRVTQAGRYSFTYAGDSSRFGGSSSAITVEVQTKATATFAAKVVSGRLLTRYGVGIAGQRVTLQVRKATTPTWSTLTTLTTSSTGTLRRAVGPTVKTYYRWTYAAAASTSYSAATSNYVTYLP